MEKDVWAKVQKVAKRSKAFPDDPGFWGKEKDAFLGATGGEVNDLLLEGVTQAEALGLGINFDLVNQQVLKYASTFKNQWWGRLEKTTREGLRTAIATNIETGAPLSSLRRNLTPFFGATRADMIASTEVTRLFAEGNKIAYRDAGVAELEWRSVVDDRVCPECEERDGKRYPINDPGATPPLHVRCRCWIAPVVAGKPLTEIVGGVQDPTLMADPSILQEGLLIDRYTKGTQQTMQWAKDYLSRRGYKCGWNGQVNPITSTKLRGYRGVALQDGSIQLDQSVLRDIHKLYSKLGDPAYQPTLDELQSLNTLFHEMVHLTSPAKTSGWYSSSMGQVLEEGLTDLYSSRTTVSLWESMSGRVLKAKIRGERVAVTNPFYKSSRSVVDAAARASGASTDAEILTQVNKWKKLTPDGGKVDAISKAIGKNLEIDPLKVREVFTNLNAPGSPRALAKAAIDDLQQMMAAAAKALGEDSVGGKQSKYLEWHDKQGLLLKSMTKANADKIIREAVKLIGFAPKAVRPEMSILMEVFYMGREDLTGKPPPVEVP